ncbi:MAG: mechanosensitive ion channel family protein [Bdellovibrionales bacterium]|nr:mechanosensitive ion channel family protein [Bdellovibrionales bacterium]
MTFDEIFSFLDNAFLKFSFIILIGLFLAQYKRFFILFLIKKLFYFLPQNIKDILIEKNKTAYFLLIFSIFCWFSFQFIPIESDWGFSVFTPLKFIFTLGVIMLLWGGVDILEELIFSRLSSLKTDDFIIKNLLPYSKKILKTLVAIVVALVFFQNIGLNVTSILASLGIGGLAFALAAKETLGHFFGGISIILDKPFYLGDWIVCKDIEGVVEDIGFRSTKIKTFYDSVVTIPNSFLANSTIDNLGKRTARRTRITLDLTYDTSPEKVEVFVEGLQNIIRSNSYTRKDYYQCYFSGLGSHSLQVFLNFFLKVSNWDEELLQKQNVFLEILRLAKHLDIDFAFPTQTLDMPHKPGEKLQKEDRFSIENLKNKVRDFGPQGSLAKPEGLGFYEPRFKK